NISGVQKEVKQTLDEELLPDQSALCVLVKYAHWDVVREEMAQYNGRIVLSDLTEEATAALELLAADNAVATAVSQELGEPETDTIQVPEENQEG
ncbi:MAG: DUF1269 domain-containing protein, partial [Anaerolineae bacterium]|nr:DUF1269 domain-containing protein [Anaerolineae bacterium]